MVKKYSKDEVVKGVLDFLKSSSHEGVIGDIANSLSSVSEIGKNDKTAYIFSTFSLDDNDKKLVKTKLETMVGHEINLREKIDKRLLGGFKIKLGDWVYDASLKGQLESLKNELYGNI